MKSKQVTSKYGTRTARDRNVTQRSIRSFKKKPTYSTRRVSVWPETQYTNRLIMCDRPRDVTHVKQ